MNFRIGQKVVCINNRPSKPHRYYDPAERPVEGAVYTVIRTFIGPNGYTPCVWLEEISRSLDTFALYGPDVGYACWRFRPLVSRGMEILDAIRLNPTAPLREKVDA